MITDIFDRLNIELDKVCAVLGYDPQNPLLFNTGLFLILFVFFIGLYRMLRRFSHRPGIVLSCWGCV